MQPLDHKRTKRNGSVCTPCLSIRFFQIWLVIFPIFFYIHYTLFTHHQLPTLPKENPLTRLRGTIHNTTKVAKNQVHSYIVEQQQHQNASTPPILISQPPDLQEQRRLAVKKAMQHAWNHYEAIAFGGDELAPISGEKRANVWGNIACSLVDGMDTLWIMELKEEFIRARNYIRDHLSFNHLGKDGIKISVFETIIRELGGLLSAFSLSQDIVFKNKAIELMEVLIPAFDINQGVFYTYFNPFTKEKSFASWNQYHAAIADIGTLQLETRYLSDITGNATYRAMGEAFYRLLQAQGAYKNTSLFPILYDPKTKSFDSYSRLTIGALGDSFYEYLLKVFIYSGKLSQDLYLRQFYDQAVDGIEQYLLYYSEIDHLYFLTDRILPSMEIVYQMDHLECFLPGLLALGTIHDPFHDELKKKRHLKLAQNLMDTCYAMYSHQPTGLSPDTISFPSMKAIDSKYKLRPEAIESLFYLWRITKNETYRDYGWKLFESIEKYAKTKYGYGAIENVEEEEKMPRVENKMESFFLAETLKYHYLLQASNDLIPLNQYVFNTEAHPFRIKEF